MPVLAGFPAGVTATGELVIDAANNAIVVNVAHNFVSGQRVTYSTGGGLAEVPNPSALFLSNRDQPAPGSAVFSGRAAVSSEESA